MSTSYQTIPSANAPTDEPSSTPVPRMKKVAVAAMMVSMAFVVVGYLYGASNNNNPAMIKSVTNSFAKMEEEEGGGLLGSCFSGDRCYDLSCSDVACKEREGCYWYPFRILGKNQCTGTCSSCSGVNCGNNYPAINCHRCLSYRHQGEKYCQGECKWGYNWAFISGCRPKWMTSHPLP